MNKTLTLRLLLGTVSVAILTAIAWACGGGYEPEGMLTLGDYSVISPLRTTFDADFKKEFGRRLAPNSTEELPRLDRTSVVEAVMRTMKEDHAKRGLKFDPDVITPPHPLELSLYLASLETDRLEAVPLCERILALPPEQRRNLTALAHYRLARMLMGATNWEEMTEQRARLRMASIRHHLNATKQAVEDGYPDICKVSLQCDGWIAYSESMIAPADLLEKLGVADFGKALRTYLAMRARGEASGSSSALHLIRKLAREGAFEACAKDPDLRRLMTIYLCGGGSVSPYAPLDQGIVNHYAARWLEALDKARIPASDDALRIANLQYSSGNWNGCAESLKFLRADDPMAALLRARVNLRQDNLSGAIASLRPAVNEAQTGPLTEYMGSETSREELYRSTYYLQASTDDVEAWTSRVRGELGVLLLRDNDYVGAMGAFYSSDKSRDAAYVGECLLSVDELKHSVDATWPKPMLKKEVSVDNQPRIVPVRYEVRHLLARRLFREGRWDEAMPYFPDDVRPVAARYVELRRKADRWSLDRLGRADAYWRAALIMAKQGDGLIHNDFGRYWSPDGSWYLRSAEITTENWHERPDLPKLRLQVNDWRVPTDYVKPSDDEITRAKAWIKKNLEKPDRSHRMASYASIDLIMRAVSFLPDNDVRGSLMLQYAGNQLRYVEPMAVQPAYRTLAIRFKKTPLGRHAWNKHWFSHDDGSEDPDLLSK
jgi:tetratricopeptide (TPR) repeat protein